MELNAEKIRSLLRFNTDVCVFDEVTSTNDVAREKGGVVFALRQTAGRGRRGRSFFSGEGGLYFSIAVKLEGGNMILGDAELPFSAGRLTIAAGIAVAKTLRSYGYDALVKWVNDVYVCGKKVCGILAEGAGTRAVLGVGINLASTIPADLACKAASLGFCADPDVFAADVLNAIAAEVKAPDLDFLCTHCLTVGKLVSTEFGTGMAVGIDMSGALEVEFDGAIKKVFVGEAIISEN